VGVTHYESFADGGGGAAEDEVPDEGGVVQGEHLRCEGAHTETKEVDVGDGY
jgi:hypothetical protein